MRPPTLAEVVGVLEEHYDPSWAESWDRVGLVAGDPDAPVRSVLFAVDPAAAVAAEAADGGFDLLVTHHPLYLRPTSSVAATSPKGRVVHRLVTAGVALHVAHTNADVARPGVSDALAQVAGLVETEPVVPAFGDPLDKLTTYVPHADTDRVVDALAAAGAGALGAYTRCAWLVGGTGTFRPEDGADPAIGTVGEIETVPETRVEMVVPRGRRAAVVRALLAAHPYEEPAYDVLEMAASPGTRGLGRVGRLRRPATLRELGERLAAGLPSTAGPVRLGGDLDRVVERVAVVGGAGDDVFAEVAATGADAYVTSDLRHHPASEELAHGRMGLVDVPHWAGEWPWLRVAAARLVESLTARGATVSTRVSEVVTDPWSHAVPPAVPLSSSEPPGGLR